MPILKLLAELGLNKTGFDAGMDAATAKSKAFSNSLKSTLAGAFSVAAIAAYTRHVIETVSHIEDLSQKVGVGTETLQELDYAAKQSGSSLDAVANSFRALSKARLEALQDKNSKAGQAFGAMGISSGDLKSENLEQTWKRIAETIRTTDFGAAELAIVDELLGRAAGELLPMFKAGVEQSSEEARNLGLIISDEVVSSIDDAGDAIDRMATKLKATVAPAIKYIVDRMRDLYDLADLMVGNIGAIIGALSGGATFQEARQAGQDHVFEVLNRREREDAEEQEKLKNRREGKDKEGTKRVAKEFKFEAKAVEKDRKAFALQETAFGRIGAFTGAATAAAMPAGTREQIESLKKIENALLLKGIIVRDAKRS